MAMGENDDATEKTDEAPGADDEETSTRIRSIRTSVSAKRSDLGEKVPETGGKAREKIRGTFREVRNTVQHFEYDLESSVEGYSARVELDADDRHEFKRAFEEAIAGRDLAIDYELEYDIRGHLDIDLATGAGDVDPEELPEGESDGE